MSNDPAVTYSWLMASTRESVADPFDAHVCASVLAMAIVEAAATGASVCDHVGLDGQALYRLLGDMFPGALAEYETVFRPRVQAVDAEVQSLRDILWMYASPGGALQRDLAAIIARRCIAPHHLWQDLGLRERVELSRLMTRHFAPLAAKNRSDMKWKKFLYRMVCGTEGFVFCAAPVCSECDDFALCFGAEDGESLLARAGNARAVVD